ncbi:Major Facilitator Superfamily protein [Andreprevotia lacus DSM 23236]|jgi:MFS family permease|uniref:Major Facilitator Superfamily protein n=1 Tax=Andreprevotia lacus DSM 23236 TaxID=1121001 RepID=A0A1W1X6B6_9NEIS|nr:lysophospholipid transporter LplT [Andreprevotia lacus]SMC19475.1 Major Facilitator Superfamily protein [Andreprevotia lacus DSM 23236]
MDRGFFLILSAQFLSALADNALFIAAMALLKEQMAPSWHHSMLLECFTLSYVILAPFAGSFADSMHKGKAMMICNGIKLMGCVAMLAGMDPLLAYGIVGFGAAAYSPAKYGLITEYLPHEKLVEANGWLEGATVGAIIFGTVLGGALTGQAVGDWLDAMEFIPEWFSPAPFAICIILLLYLCAAWLNIYIPKLNVQLKPLEWRPMALIHEFSDCVKRLWQDPQGQLSLAVTTLFWGAGATMRLVVLNWAVLWLNYSIQQATLLVATVAVGTAVGAVLAGRFIPLKKAFNVLPAGVAMGVLVMSMLLIHTPGAAAGLMFVVGILSGFFVVPLNAMLQHRGYLLMGAGHSIAVQNFNENLGILVMVGLHVLLVKYLSSPVPANAQEIVKDQFAVNGMPPMHVIVLGFGLFVAVSMVLVIWRYRRGVRAGIMHD